MLRRVLVRALILVCVMVGSTTLAFAGAPAPAAEQIPCRDDVHCPDLVIDERYLAQYLIETRNFSETSCAVQEGSVPPGRHKLLHAQIATPNIGTQDLVIGTYDDNPSLFEWGECHRHWHYIAYAELRLWSVTGYAEWLQLRLEHPEMTSAELLAAHPDLAEEFVAGSKVGFCVINIVPGYVSRSPLDYEPSGHWPNCYSMGITVGWADLYALTTEGQWIVIDDVPPGAYMLEAEVNANRLFDELEFAENAKAVPVVVV